RGTTYTLGLHFDSRRRVAQRCLEYVYGLALGAVFDHVQCAIHHAAGYTLFAATHHPINKHRNLDVVEACIRNHGALLRTVSSWHNCLPLLLARRSLGLLGSVLAAALFAVLDAVAVQRATHDVIAHAR